MDECRAVAIAASYLRPVSEAMPLALTVLADSGPSRKARNARFTCAPHNSLGQPPSAPEPFAWPGFSLKDYAPPTPMQKVALGLAWEVDRRTGSGQEIIRRLRHHGWTDDSSPVP